MTADTPSQLDVALKWLDITVERFVGNMRQLKIHDSGALSTSFRKFATELADGDVVKLRLSYALYGKFVDMGVGRGMGAGITKKDDGYDRIRNGRGQLKRRTRKARPWYRKEIAFQLHRLAELQTELKGQVVLSTIADALPTGEAVTINF
jgi:hypothetical protein